MSELNDKLLYQALGEKKMVIKTTLDSLDYPLEIGKEYWYFWSGNLEGVPNNTWIKYKVTFKRSGVIFFVFPDYPEVPEQHMEEFCVMDYMSHPDIVEMPEDLNPKYYEAQNPNGLLTIKWNFKGYDSKEDK